MQMMQMQQIQQMQQMPLAQQMPMQCAQQMQRMQQHSWVPVPQSLLQMMPQVGPGQSLVLMAVPAPVAGLPVQMQQPPATAQPALSAHSSSRNSEGPPMAPMVSMTSAALERSTVSEERLKGDSLRDLPVEGNMWRLSRDAEGCRRVQAALDDAPTDDARMLLVQELRGRVWTAMRCPHANHVLQKCFVTMRPSAVQFIIDELVAKGTKSIVKAAQNEYACRVVQRMVEHCRPDQVALILEPLLAMGSVLVRHIYGIFVMQHVLEHGTESQKSCLVAQMVEHVHLKGLDPRTGRVLRTSLCCCSSQDQLQAARAFLHAQELPAMARDRHSYTVVEHILGLLEGDDLTEATRQLCAEMPSLLASRYGKKIAANLKRTSDALLGGA